MTQDANQSNPTENIEESQGIKQPLTEESAQAPQNHCLWRGKFEKNGQWVDFTFLNMEIGPNGTIMGCGEDQTGTFSVNGVCSPDGSISLSQKYDEGSGLVYEGKMTKEGVVEGKIITHGGSCGFFLQVDSEEEGMKAFLENLKPTTEGETSERQETKSQKLNRKKMHHNRSAGSLSLRNVTVDHNSSVNNSSSLFLREYGNRIYSNLSASTLSHSINSYTIPKQSRFDKSQDLNINGNMYNMKSTLSSRGTCLGLGSKGLFKKRFVSDVGGIPGANAYFIKSQFEKNRDTPAKTFGLSYNNYTWTMPPGLKNYRPLEESKVIPGPNAYRPLIKDKPSKPEYTVCKKGKMFNENITEISPGAVYVLKHDMVEDKRFSTGTTFGLGKKSTLWNTKNHPGPGAYKLPSIHDKYYSK